MKKVQKIKQLLGNIIGKNLLAHGFSVFAA